MTESSRNQSIKSLHNRLSCFHPFIHVTHDACHSPKFNHQSQPVSYCHLTTTKQVNPAQSSPVQTSSYLYLPTYHAHLLHHPHRGARLSIPSPAYLQDKASTLHSHIARYACTRSCLALFYILTSFAESFYPVLPDTILHTFPSPSLSSKLMPTNTHEHGTDLATIHITGTLLFHPAPARYFYPRNVYFHVFMKITFIGFCVALGSVGTSCSVGVVPT